MKAFNQLSQSGIYREDEISVSITVCGGTYGGGSEVLVVNGNSNVVRSGERGNHEGGCPTLNCTAEQPILMAEEQITSIVRRLTPLECERLQGFPDGWTDIGEWTDSKGKKHKDADSPRYKALGNSIALPFWQWLARRIVAQYEGEVTMGSLFDGIGGFPLVFERCGAKAIWASEIEEFCIAVTKKRFPDGESNDNTSLSG